MTCDNIWNIVLCILQKCCKIEKEIVEKELEKSLGKRSPCEIDDIERSLIEVGLGDIVRIDLG